MSSPTLPQSTKTWQNMARYENLSHNVKLFQKQIVPEPPKPRKLILGKISKKKGKNIVKGNEIVVSTTDNTGSGSALGLGLEVSSNDSTAPVSGSNSGLDRSDSVHDTLSSFTISKGKIKSKLNSGGVNSGSGSDKRHSSKQVGGKIRRSNSRHRRNSSLQLDNSDQLASNSNDRSSYYSHSQSHSQSSLRSMGTGVISNSTISDDNSSSFLSISTSDDDEVVDDVSYDDSNSNSNSNSSNNTNINKNLSLSNSK
ncbi:unnamed protein product [[Candida] boidinii]|nr:unnamed protein product [[Candida] boidinii]